MPLPAVFLSLFRASQNRWLPFVATHSLIRLLISTHSPFPLSPYVLDSRIVNFLGAQDAVVKAFERVALKLQTVHAMVAAGGMGSPAPSLVMNMATSPAAMQTAAMHGLAIAPGEYGHSGCGSGEVVRDICVQKFDK